MENNFLVCAMEEGNSSGFCDDVNLISCDNAPQVPVSVGLLDLSQVGLGLVLLEAVLGQEDPVLEVREARAEVLLLVVLPPLVQAVALLDRRVQR